MAFGKSGIKQKSLANQMNVSPSTVTRWKSGDSLLDMQTISRISEQIGIKVTEMIQQVEEK
jgi:ribosome-binding protein aMBF1 (putative translation factor)